MTIDFPSSPSDGQVYLAGAVSWTWSGGHWISSYLSAAGGLASPSTLVVTATATLPAGFGGFVRVENPDPSPISVFLPASPSEGQEIEIKDTLGNAGSFPITVDGVGQMIEGSPTMVIAFNYGWVDLIYTGSLWVQR